MEDTHPEARAFQLDGWARMTTRQRLAQLASCWRTGRTLQAEKQANILGYTGTATQVFVAAP